MQDPFIQLRLLNDSDPDQLHITIITAGTFEELVLDESKDVMLLCWHLEYCSALAMRPSSLQLLTYSNHILISVLLGSTRKIMLGMLVTFLQRQHQTMMLFPRGHKSDPTFFPALPYTKALLVFLHQHIDHPKFDLQAALSDNMRYRLILNSRISTRISFPNKRRCMTNGWLKEPRQHMKLEVIYYRYGSIT